MMLKKCQKLQINSYKRNKIRLINNLFSFNNFNQKILKIIKNLNKMYIRFNFNKKNI